MLTRCRSIFPLMPLSRLAAHHSRMLSRSHGGRLCGRVACVWPVAVPTTRSLSKPCLGHKNRTRGAAQGPVSRGIAKCHNPPHPGLNLVCCVDFFCGATGSGSGRVSRRCAPAGAAVFSPALSSLSLSLLWPPRLGRRKRRHAERFLLAALPHERRPFVAAEQHLARSRRDVVLQAEPVLAQVLQQIRGVKLLQRERRRARRGLEVVRVVPRAASCARLRCPPLSSARHTCSRLWGEG